MTTTITVHVDALDVRWSSFWVFNLFCFVGDPLLYLSLVHETKNRLT